MTDDQLRAWDNEESDIGDDLHDHFSEWGKWDWCDIAEEARRIQTAMFGTKVERYSPQDAITSAAVAHADHMAYEAMAAALGVNANDLRCTIARWSENQSNLPPSVTADQLMQMVEETKNEFANWRKDAEILGLLAPRLLKH